MSNAPVQQVRVALDTTILASAEGIEGDARQAAACELLKKLAPHATVLPAQALAELASVLIGNAGRPAASVRHALVTWRDAYPVVATSADTVTRAADLMAIHHVTVWEAIMVAAAAEADCRLLLSQSFGAGIVWSDVTVTNPFADRLHPLLAELRHVSGPPQGRPLRRFKCSLRIDRPTFTCVDV
jgi:predicted nucleic acid-binding protein